MTSSLNKRHSNNWRSSNIGIMLIGLLIIMPFGLVLLAMLTFGKSINLAAMFKDFWSRITNGPDFEQPALWGNGTTKYNHKNQAYNQYRRQQDAEFNAKQSAAKAQLADEQYAFEQYIKAKKLNENKAEFEKFQQSI